MGLLTEGAPLQWSEIEKHKDYIKKHGIIQFINLYNREKNRYDTEHKWGDEVEYTLVKFDDVNKTVKVSCRAAEILPRLQAEEELNNMLGMENAGYWRPEFASFQIEGSPGTPFGEDLSCFNDVESNLNERRKQVKRFLKKNESMMSISFPGLGAPNFTFPPMKPEPSQSIFFPNDAVNGAHPRYKTLMNIIKDRRGDKIDFHIPVFKDVKTPDPFYDALGQGGECQSARADHIYLDHMGIGCGCCGLQVTMQTVNENECRWLYDQLTPLTPVFLALSAASPIFKSILSDLDCRWEALSASVDDRNREERGLSPLNKFPFKIDKRRLGTTDCYVHSTSVASNDLKILYDEEVYKTLLDGEIDEPLAKHIAHLFIRDPLVVYHERIIQDDEECSEHFETIQCTNWNNVRFKPPPSDIPEIGWRVEFRPTEVQLTDFETAAYCCFIVLLSRVIIHMKLNVIIPISMVDENMKRAQKRDAVLREKFFFRNNATYNATPSCNGIPDSTEAPEIEEYSIDEIINGKKNDFAGLIPLIRQYLDHENLEQANRTKMEEYLDFIGKRASGKINTLAKWMRNFVATHPSYKKDSQVPTDTMYEMLKTMDDIAAGRKHCEKLLGSFRTKMTPLYERERKETTTSEFENSKDKINDIFMDSFDRKAFYELVEPKL